jgi:outer membrane protein TolC
VKLLPLIYLTGLNLLKNLNMEKARFLPRVGAFAEGYMFNGPRDTADGYMAGLYLQWSLFNPSDYGTLKEARLKSMAAEKYSEAIEQRERAEKQALDKSVLAYKENLLLLNDSLKILAEQTQVTETLFKNGSINALQFVEVLSRRADVVDNQTEASLGLLKASSEGITKTHFELPAEFSQTGVKEQ